MAAFASAGMRTFVVVWFGQLISMLGTGMTRFAIMIWVWERMGEATPLVLVGVVGAIPALASGLIAGSLVDRWNRQSVMIVSDSIAGLSSLAILLLYSTQQLQVWHLYITSAIVGWVGTFQGLAFSAGLTMLIPKAQFARARGMMSLAEYISIIGAPLLGGLLIGILGISGVLVIDILTFLFAVGTLFVVAIPQPPPVEMEVRKPLWQDSVSGFQYIFQRPGLLGLLMVVFGFSLSEALAYPLIRPMILARTGNEVLLGTVLAMQGVGGVVGGLLLIIWGGPKRRIHGVLIGAILTGLLGDTLMGLGRSLPIWIIAGIFLELFIPIILGSYHAIWQAKVTPGMQGRVFAARDLLATFGEPVSMLIGGVMTDQVFEPAMKTGGSLSGVFGWLVGTGPGAGMALLMVIGGLLSAAAGLLGYAFYRVRNVETLLPDYDEAPQPATSD